MHDLSGFQIVVLGVVLMALCAVPTCVLGYILARAFRRVQDENRDLLQANLALSSKPAAVQLAIATEQTERAQIEADARSESPTPRRVYAGAG